MIGVVVIKFVECCLATEILELNNMKWNGWDVIQ